MKAFDTHQLWFLNYYKEFSEIEGRFETKSTNICFLFSGHPFSNSNLAICAKSKPLASHGTP
jgi:hypothetical protein